MGDFVLRLSFLLMASIFACVSSTAGVIEVPEDYLTIQEALSNAQAADTVLVAPGTYQENIIWPETADIVLISEQGTNQTIIDGDSSGTVITLLNAIVDSSTVISGFTIRNGAAEQGGGIRCSLSSPLIVGNVIEDCFAVSDGGGIYCSNSAVVIHDNTIRNNSTGIPLALAAPDWTGEKYLTTGGGISLSGGGGGTAIISNNVISLNYCTYYGGGIASSRNALIIGNQIIDNLSEWFGGGVYHLNAGGTVLEANLISGNTSNWGGGIMLQGGSLTITNCDVINNNGDGMHIYYGSLTADSSSFSGNTGDGIATGATKLFKSRSGSVHYCQITDNDGFGIRSVNDWFTFNATLNWWGDPSGPGGVGPGSGDEVSRFVDYDPWLVQTGILVESGETAAVSGIHVQNPVRSAATVTIEGLGSADLHVYDLTGRIIATLYSGTLNGSLSVDWNASDLAPGMYFFQFDTGGETFTAKTMVIR